jgi:hypothetical protein
MKRERDAARSEAEAALKRAEVMKRMGGGVTAEEEEAAARRRRAEEEARAKLKVPYVPMQPDTTRLAELLRPALRAAAASDSAADASAIDEALASLEEWDDARHGWRGCTEALVGCSGSSLAWAGLQRRFGGGTGWHLAMQCLPAAQELVEQAQAARLRLEAPTAEQVEAGGAETDDVSGDPGRLKGKELEAAVRAEVPGHEQAAEALKRLHEVLKAAVNRADPELVQQRREEYKRNAKTRAAMRARRRPGKAAVKPGAGSGKSDVDVDADDDDDDAPRPAEVEAILPCLPREASIPGTAPAGAAAAGGAHSQSRAEPVEEADDVVADEFQEDIDAAVNEAEAAAEAEAAELNVEPEWRALRRIRLHSAPLTALDVAVLNTLALQHAPFGAYLRWCRRWTAVEAAEALKAMPLTTFAVKAFVSHSLASPLYEDAAASAPGAVSALPPSSQARWQPSLHQAVAAAAVPRTPATTPVGVSPAFSPRLAADQVADSGTEAAMGFLAGHQPPSDAAEPPAPAKAFQKQHSSTPAASPSLAPLVLSSSLVADGGSANDHSLELSITWCPRFRPRTLRLVSDTIASLGRGLRRVDLSFTQLPPKAMLLLASSLRDSRSLTELVLGGCGLGPWAAEPLVSLCRSTPALRRLAVPCNSLRAPGVAMLCELLGGFTPSSRRAFSRRAASRISGSRASSRERSRSRSRGAQKRVTKQAMSRPLTAEQASQHRIADTRLLDAPDAGSGDSALFRAHSRDERRSDAPIVSTRKGASGPRSKSRGASGPRSKSRGASASDAASNMPHPTLVFWDLRCTSMGAAGALAVTEALRSRARAVVADAAAPSAGAGAVDGEGVTPPVGCQPVIELNVADNNITGAAAAALAGVLRWGFGWTTAQTIRCVQPDFPSGGDTVWSERLLGESAVVGGHASLRDASFLTAGSPDQLRNKHLINLRRARAMRADAARRAERERSAQRRQGAASTPAQGQVQPEGKAGMVWDPLAGRSLSTLGSRRPSLVSLTSEPEDAADWIWSKEAPSGARASARGGGGGGEHSARSAASSAGAPPPDWVVARFPEQHEGTRLASTRVLVAGRGIDITLV